MCGESPWIENLEVLITVGEQHGAKFEALDSVHPAGQSVAIYRY